MRKLAAFVTFAPVEMRFSTRAVLLVSLLAVTSRLQATVPLQTVSLRLLPQNTVGAGCPMLSASGGTTTSYSTANAEGNVFAFDDPLPQGALLQSLAVEISTLATCLPANRLEIYLNPDMQGVHPFYSRIGGVAPTSSFNSCSTPAQFRISEAESQAMIAPEISPYISGGTNQLRVTEYPDQACGDVRIEYLQVTLRFYVDLPVINFELGPASDPEQRKVLMHRWRDDFDYLSTAQEILPGTTAETDRRILIRGTVTDASGLPLPGERVLVRTSDPPDPSPYMPAASSHRGDNPYGWHLLPPLPRDILYQWSEVTADGQGRFEVVMPMTDRFAGDNQVVEASTIYLPYPAVQDRCKAALGCYTTGVITAWRRVYLEVDRMFRKGTFIRANVQAGDDTVAVFSRDGFENAKPNNPVPIIIMHAPGYEVSDPAGQFYMERRNVIRVRGGKQNPVLVLNQPLTHPYFVRASETVAALPAGDAVGIYRGDDDLFQAHVDLALDSFKESYVDYKVLDPVSINLAPFIPYVGECPSAGDYCTEIAGFWFDHRKGRRARDNHQHLAVAGAWRAGITGLAAMGQYGSFPLAAFIWNQVIDDGVSDPGSNIGGLNPRVVSEETVVHELVHLYDVNPPAVGNADPAYPPSSGHCPFDAFDGGHCLMNDGRTKAERGDRRVSLHVQLHYTGPVPFQDPFGHSEYRRVRRREEPMPQFFQPKQEPNH